MDWEGEFWTEEDGEEDDEDEEDDEVEEEDEDEEEEEDDGADCCGLCPFLLVMLLVTGSCLESAVRAGDWV